jgi:2-succinyl-5-enolpyruvyl-6-hydroxy-3-cyclohexene-1-carboxylate synthase
VTRPGSGSARSEAERSFEAAWLVVNDLVRFGVREACVSPGSRSTPIALALWRHPEIHVYVHLDERSSAFFALGIAKATGRPVVAATTSGTAVAELLPAVVEAWMSRTVLVLLTADRPPELRGVGANQTIDQPEIFGRYVLASIDAPVPSDVADPDRWHEIVGEATRASMGPPPGPVHLNLPFREPLVPRPGSLPAFEWRDIQYSISEEATPEAVRDLVAALGSTTRGVILAGSLRESPSGLDDIAERVRWPLLAEPTSGCRRRGTLSAGQHLIADPGFLERHLPEVVLQLGAAPTSRAGLELVRRAARLLILDPDHLVADPHRKASMTVHADLAGLVPELVDAMEPRPETPWWREWHAADRAARVAVDSELDADDVPFEGRVARDLAVFAPEGAILAVGSSQPVRDLDAFMAPRGGLGILANRGASGIDGFVSTVIGVSTTGHPTFGLLGDLTLLHDVGGLAWSADRGYEAVLVVLNNGGGAIFDRLPQRDLPELDPLFVTPHGVDLAALCTGVGVAQERVERARDLVPAVERASSADGLAVVEVVVDRDHDRGKRARIRTAVERSLGEL